MIILENLQKHYGDHIALDGVSLQVKQGELFAYLGPNGAGKSTTIRILSGLTRLTGGRVLVGGADIESHPQTAKRQCGLVVQHTNVDNDLTLHENMDIHGRLFGMTAADRSQQTQKLLDYVDLSERQHQRVGTLSGGMKRRLMIARALMHRPKILFLDEPTVGLDADVRRRLWGLIKTIQAEGTTIFLTTHYIEEAEFLADRVAFIKAGKLSALDTPSALKAQVGEWAIDHHEKEGTLTEYFPDHATAQGSIHQLTESLTIRRVNLEDAFLKMTSKGTSPC